MDILLSLDLLTVSCSLRLNYAFKKIHALISFYWIIHIYKMLNNLTFLLVAFLPIAILASQEKQNFPIPKVLWTYWDDGLNNAGLFTKLCINNMIHYSR